MIIPRSHLKLQATLYNAVRPAFFCILENIIVTLQPITTVVCGFAVIRSGGYAESTLPIAQNQYPYNRKTAQPYITHRK